MNYSYSVKNLPANAGERRRQRRWGAQQALLVPGVRQELRRAQEPDHPPPQPHQGAAVRVRRVREELQLPLGPHPPPDDPPRRAALQVLRSEGPLSRHFSREAAIRPGSPSKYAGVRSSCVGLAVALSKDFGAPRLQEGHRFTCWGCSRLSLPLPAPPPPGCL